MKTSIFVCSISFVLFVSLFVCLLVCTFQSTSILRVFDTLNAFTGVAKHPSSHLDNEGTKELRVLSFNSTSQLVDVDNEGSAVGTKNFNRYTCAPGFKFGQTAKVSNTSSNTVPMTFLEEISNRKEDNSAFDSTCKPRRWHILQPAIPGCVLKNKFGAAGPEKSTGPWYAENETPGPATCIEFTGARFVKSIMTCTCHEIYFKVWQGPLLCSHVLNYLMLLQKSRTPTSHPRSSPCGSANCSQECRSTSSTGRK